MNRFAVLVGMLFVAQVAVIAKAADPTGGKPVVRSLSFRVCYVREATDQAWSVRVEGTLPRGPGVYVIVRNEKGEPIHRGEIPWGTYTAEKPYLMTIKPDGIAGDYAIQIIGQQDNLTGIALPLTTLPLEVYGDLGFALGDAKSNEVRIISFQVPEPAEIVMSGFRANYRILNADGSVLIDSKTAALPLTDPTRHFKSVRDFETHFKAEPGKVYWIDPYEVRYFGPKDPLYLTYDPKRWFAPKVQWKIDQDKWWKGLAP